MKVTVMQVPNPMGRAAATGFPAATVTVGMTALGRALRAVATLVAVVAAVVETVMGLVSHFPPNKSV
jgi:hypothetical protein